MPYVPRFAVPLLTLAAIAATAPAAQAVEQEGTGSNITPVKNLAFPNLHDEETTNAGTDIEFATLTVGAAQVAAAPEAPIATPAEVAATAPSAKKAKKAKKARAPLSCRKAKNRYRSRASRRRYAAQCRRALARRRAKARKRSFKDAAPSQAGLQREFAFAGSYGDGLQIIDITDPANSTLVSTWDCGASQGDVQVFRRDDLGGRWFVSYAHDSGYTFEAESQCYKDLAAAGFGEALEKEKGEGTYVADITDPYHPKSVSYIPVAQGSHNQTVHPSGKYLYNSNSDLITSFQPAVEIVDISDLAAPKPVGELALQTFPGLGTESHDITFSSDGTRAYSAALSHAEIIDTTDPAKPESIGTIVDPTINVFHQSDPVKIGDRNFLFIEDEVAGAVGTGQCPNGGVHVYDITGDLETNPQKVGYWNITDTGPTEDGTELQGGGVCTAHVFRLHEDAQLMTIAYYNGGVRVVDISAVEGVALGTTGVGMKQLGSYRFPDSNTWSVKAPRVSRDGFYMYANDHRRGVDVYHYKPEGEATPAGRWYSPGELVAAQEKARAQGFKPRMGAVCLLGKDGVMQAATQAGLAIR